MVVNAAGVKQQPALLGGEQGLGLVQNLLEDLLHHVGQRLDLSVEVVSQRLDLFLNVGDEGLDLLLQLGSLGLDLLNQRLDLGLAVLNVSPVEGR